MQVPHTIDVLQEGNRRYAIPVIRVWCHPHKIGKSGDDYYYTFDDFYNAVRFCKDHLEAEDYPLIAFRGYEINLFEIKGRNDPKPRKSK